MKYKATFQQSVEGVETAEVVVEADTFEDAMNLIEHGGYQKYLVVDSKLARVKHLGTVEVVQID